MLLVAGECQGPYNSSWFGQHLKGLDHDHAAVVITRPFLEDMWFLIQDLQNALRERLRDGIPKVASWIPGDDTAYDDIRRSLL